MPTREEVLAQLTGPGGMFEVVTEDVDGVPIKVFKERMRCLRQVFEMGVARGDGQEYIVYGDRRIGFGTFGRQANGVAAALRERHGIGHGDRVAVLSGNNPEWVLAFWATTNLGAILVGLNGWWKADEIVYGLEDSGSRVLVADKGRFERISSMLGDLPDLEAIYLIDADPSDYSDPRIHRFDELVSETDAVPDTPIDESDYAVIFYTSGTTGRPKGAISSHRSMIANLQNTMFNAVAGAMQGGGEVFDTSGASPTQTASLLTSPMFHVSGCHSGIVVGLLAGHQARDPGRKVRARQGAAAHPGREDQRVGDGAHHGVARRRASRPSLLRHVVAARRRGLPLHHRSRQGHDHPRRREHLLRRDPRTGSSSTRRSPTRR